MKYQIFPDLTNEEYSELKTDIAERGVQIPIELDDEGNILDGHHRVKICKELGITDYPTVTRYGLSEKEKLLHVRKLNIARRHLNREQKRQLVKEQLKETPEVSDRQIANEFKVDHKTVGSARNELESRGEIPHVDIVTDTKGRKQPRKRSVFSTKEQQEKLDVIAEEAPELIKAVDEGKTTVNAAYNRVKQKKEAERTANNQPEELPEGQYKTIIVDPPWPIKKIIREATPDQNVIDYPTMSLENIENLDIKGMYAKGGTHVFLWTTQKLLHESLHILLKWGVTHMFTMVWHKTGGFQPFNLPQYNCEFILYGRSGATKFTETKNFFTCFNADRTGHSRKPDEFYNLIRRVCPPPRIEIFSRDCRDGFEQYGNERNIRKK